MTNPTPARSANDRSKPAERGIADRTAKQETAEASGGGRARKSVRQATDKAASNDNPSKAKLWDQYYTKWDVAERYWDIVLDYLNGGPVLMVEPSAGKGAFFRLMPDGSIGIDIDRKFPGVREGNFLEMTIGGDMDICFVGNPPFGKNSTMARQFFNRAAREAKFIVMILPSTFLKWRMQNSLDPAFHLVYSETVPKKAFRFEGRLCTVPATFMIWERRAEPRERWPTETRHPDFEFLDIQEDADLDTRKGADFMIQRVGANAGMVHDNLDMSPKSHYFIRCKRPGVRAIMEQLHGDFVSFAGRVAGNPSLAKAEIVACYRRRTEGTPG